MGRAGREADGCPPYYYFLTLTLLAPLYIIFISMETLKKSVYIETTIPSVITARQSRDIGTLYRQTVTKDFWDNERHKYDLYVSEYVIEECEKGDTDAAKRRLDLIKDIPSLPKSKDIDNLAEEYFKHLTIPDRAKTDCFHLAVCVMEKIDFLLSWNLTHLGNDIFLKVYDFNQERGLKTPRLLDPDTFMSVMKLS